MINTVNRIGSVSNSKREQQKKNKGQKKDTFKKCFEMVMAAEPDKEAPKK